MNIDLFHNGCLIMAIGMGSVFFFLILMIFAMKICSFIIQKLNKIFPEEIIEKTPKNKKKTTDETEIAIAIAAAIQRSGL